MLDVLIDIDSGGEIKINKSQQLKHIKKKIHNNCKKKNIIIDDSDEEMIDVLIDIDGDGEIKINKSRQLKHGKIKRNK